MPEDLIVRYIFEDASGGGPGAAPGRHPGMTHGEVEEWTYKGRIPAPPPPPGTSELPTPSRETGIQPQLQQLATSIQGLTQMVGGPRPPVIPPPVQRPTPPPAPPPIQTPPPEDPSLSQRIAGMIPQSALPSFVGGIAARATGSATVGGLAGTGAGSIMGGLAAAGPVGIGIAAALTGIVIAGTALVETFKKLRSVASELANSIREFSPHVAYATAMAEVRTIHMRLRRAQQIGPELGAFVGAESRLDIAVEELKTAVMDDVTPILTEILNFISLHIELFTNVYKWLSDEGSTGVSALNVMSAVVSPALRLLYEAVRALNWLASWRDSGEDGADILEEFFNKFLNPNAPRNQGAAGRGRAMPVAQRGGF